MQWIAGVVTALIYLFVAIQFESWLFNFIHGLFQNADIGMIAALVAVVLTIGPVFMIGVSLTLMVVGAVTVFLK